MPGPLATKFAHFLDNLNHRRFSSRKKYIPLILYGYTRQVTMNTGLLRVLIDPGRFFEDRMQDESGLKMPALIVLIYAIISAVAAALMVNVIIDILPAEAQAFAVFGIAIAVVGALIMGFLTWIVVAAVLHIISMLFKGEGAFTRTLEFTGYAFLPQAIGSIVGAAFSYRIISGLTIPVVTDPEQIIMVTEALAR